MLFSVPFDSSLFLTLFQVQEFRCELESGSFLQETKALKPVFSGLSWDRRPPKCGMASGSRAFPRQVDQILKKWNPDGRNEMNVGFYLKKSSNKASS